MFVFLSFLILMLVIVIVIMALANVYPENIEIHILGFIKIKFKNKEKRLGGPRKAPKRTTKGKK